MFSEKLKNICNFAEANFAMWYHWLCNLDIKQASISQEWKRQAFKETVLLF